MGLNQRALVLLGTTLFILFPADSKNKFLGVNPIGLSSTRDKSLDIIALQTVNKSMGINPMGLSAPRANSLEIIDFQIVENFSRDYPNGPYCP